VLLLQKLLLVHFEKLVLRLQAGRQESQKTQKKRLVKAATLSAAMSSQGAASPAPAKPTEAQCRACRFECGSTCNRNKRRVIQTTGCRRPHLFEQLGLGGDVQVRVDPLLQ
jgi:anaerobic selenocysteine-containing dehydrogenase